MYRAWSGSIEIRKTFKLWNEYGGSVRHDGVLPSFYLLLFTQSYQEEIGCNAVLGASISASLREILDVIFVVKLVSSREMESRFFSPRHGSLGARHVARWGV